MRRSSSAQGGFTLLEVLVALVIMGIGVASILAAYSGSMRLMRQSRDQTAAATLARSKLEETLAAGAGEVVQDEAEERYNGTLFGFRITTTPLSLIAADLAERLPGGAPPALEEIKVEVFWGEENNQRRYVIASYRKPPAPPSANPGQPPVKANPFANLPAGG